MIGLLSAAVTLAMAVAVVFLEAPLELLIAWCVATWSVAANLLLNL